MVSFTQSIKKICRLELDVVISDSPVSWLSCSSHPHFYFEDTRCSVDVEVANRNEQIQNKWDDCRSNSILIWWLVVLIIDDLVYLKLYV